MTVISRRIFRPLPGKSSVAHARIQRLAEIMTRAGAKTRTSNVVWGDDARAIHLHGIFENIAAGAKMATTMNADPAFAALRTESDNDPASHWEGPEVFRCVFGEPEPGYSVLLQREYEIDRRKLKSALGLMPEVQALQPDRPNLAVVPVISGDMGRLMIVYYATSLIDLGERMDRIGVSDAFQSILVRAAEFGKLTRSRVLVNI
jgi:hypothetical protein